MASLQSTPSRRLKYEQHILEKQSKTTPPRFIPSKSTHKRQEHSDSSGSNLSSSSDPPKSFLALSAESSPTTTQAADSSPYSAAQTPARPAESATSANTSNSRHDAESSFFPFTSPVVPRSFGAGPDHLDGSVDNQEAGASAQRFISPAKPPPFLSRGSRLGAQMGRTRSEQTSTIPRDESPVSPIDYHSSTSTSPIRKETVDALQDEPRSLGTRMKRDMRSHSPITQAADRETDSFLASQESWRNGAAGPSSSRGLPVASVIASKRLGNGMPRNAESAGQVDRSDASSPTSQSPLSKRTEGETSRQEQYTTDAYSSMPVSSILPPLHEANLRGQSGELDRSSSRGEVYSPNSSFSNVTSPDRSLKNGPAMVAANRGGKLTRLQYNKVDPLIRQSKPGWDLSTAPSKGGSLTARPNLIGRVSNPNMLADFKRGEQFNESQWAETGRNDSMSGTKENALIEQQSSGQEAGTFDGAIRPAERRELMLPQLNGMRNAVESVLTTSTEAFMRKGERRKSSIAYQQLSLLNEDKVNGGQLSNQQSPREAVLEQEWHRRTPSLETNMTSPAMTEETWQRVNDFHQPSNSTSRPDYPLSSSPPTQSSIATMTGKGSDSMRRTSVKVGQLTDEAIVQLGAVPGIKPSSLLNSSGQPLSSKNILTIALQKAQSAVVLDSANNVPDAILAYRQAVRLLKEVMERVSPGSASSSRRKSSREEEGRRLKVIHDTYADRIRLLSMINAPNEELGDSSIGEDSFARQSPTPIRTMKSKDSLLLNGLGIKEGKSVNQAPPQFAIAVSPVSEDDLSANHRGTVNRKQDQTREELLDISGNRNDKRTSLHGSDSDGSFRSARGPVTRPSTGGIPALSPVPDRIQYQAMKNSVGEEVVPVPVTPYFDTDPGSNGTGSDSAGHTRTEVEESTDTQAASRPVSTSTLAPLSSDAPEERRSRSPQDRTNRGITSLHNIPSANDINNRQSSRRFLSIGSQAQFQREVSPSSPLRGRVEEGQNGKAAAGRDVASGNRPRALTMGLNERGRMLVSATTTSGMISQRRKMAAAGLVSGSSDEVYRSDGVSLDTPATRNGSAGVDTLTQIAASSEDDFDDQTDAKFIAGRKRAISQPSNRRPSIPASFMNIMQPHSGPSQGLPPVPKIKRKASMPLSPLFFQQQQQGTLKATSNSAAAFRFPSPAPSATSGYHALGTPSSVLGQYPWCSPTAVPNSGENMSNIASGLFPTSLPSLQMGAVPSYTSNSYDVILPWIGVTTTLPDAASFVLPPAQKSLRPFYVMKLLQGSIERGSYITKRLYLSRDLWLQSGSRLLAIETKVRMLDSISNGIDGIEQTGHFLLHPSHMDHPGLNAINASKFLKLLEEFETLLIEVQNTLAKKLGFLETVDGKKSGTSFGSFGSKLTRSLDRMTNNAKSHIDTPANYVDGLSRLFIKAQVIGEHLRTLDRSKRELESPTRDSEWDDISIEVYATLPAAIKSSIEFKLRKASEFFNSVILRFVLRDVAILVDKSVKRNSVLLTE